MVHQAWILQCNAESIISYPEQRSVKNLSLQAKENSVLKTAKEMENIPNEQELGSVEKFHPKW